MCTVTLTPLPKQSGFALTSNRDEAPERETLPPKIYSEAGVKLLFPKDKLAGGTWLGVSEKNRALCLLNGEFKPHLRKPPYRISRGIIVKQLLAADDLSGALEEIDLSEVEPFTLVIAEWYPKMSFLEFVWDAQQKHLRKLPLSAHLWSSSPLYSEEMKAERWRWFQKFQNQQEISPEALLKFHFSAGKGDPENGVIMDRGFIKTKSISQIIFSEEKITFYYKDLETGEETKLDF